MKKHLLPVLLTVALLIGNAAMFAFPSLASGVTAADYDALYVKDGLVRWFDAYDSGNGTVDLTGGKWYAKDSAGNKTAYYASLLTPAKWKAAAGGGIGFSMTGYADWQTYVGKIGLDLGVSNLPSGDFTVEYVTKMDGLTDGSGNDVAHTQAMNGNQYGLYDGNQSAWVFGTWHFMQFMLSTASGGNSLNGRMMYSANQSYNKTSYANCMGDQSLLGGVLHVPQSFSVTFDYTAKTGAQTYDGAAYAFYRGQFLVTSFDNRTTSYSSGKTYLPNSTGGFRLMGDFPGTVYTVRVYDRVLTEAERRQNYFVDLCREYGVDVRGVSSLSPEDRTSLFDYAANIRIDSAEQEKLENLAGMIGFFTGYDLSIAGRVLTYNGLQARLDGDVPAIRALFSADDALVALLEKRYTVRYGAIMGIGEMDGKVLCRPSDLTVADNGTALVPCAGARAAVIYSTAGDYGATGKYTEQKAGVSSFAFTTQYAGGGATVSNFGIGMVYRGFVSLTDGDGNTVFFYTDASGDNFGRDDSRYGVGAGMREVADYYVNRYEESTVKALSYNRNPLLCGILSDCGDERQEYLPGRSASEVCHIYVSADGSDTAAGTENAPYRSIGKAYDRAKAVLSAAEQSISVIIHLGDGVYATEQTLTLSGTDIGTDDYWFTVMGDDGAVVTSNVAIDSASFTKVPGKDYYVAQLPKDGNGKYPGFRYLFVDGKPATLAYAGYQWYADAAAAGVDQWNTGATNNDVSAGDYRIYCYPEPFVGLSDAELKTIELHDVVEWEFKIMHVDHVDFNDKDAAGRVAVYMNEHDFKATVKTNLTYQNRHYWLENSLAFLDTPGEFYYDHATGKVYYMPEEGKTPEDLAFAYPTLEQIMSFRDVKNVTLEGFTVNGADNRYVERNGYYDGSQAGGTGTEGFPQFAAVYGEDMDNTAVYDVHFSGLCGDGISVRGKMDGMAVDSCTFDDIGVTAIRLGNGNAYTAAAHLCDGSVNNNKLHNIAWYLRQNCAIYVSVAKDTKITHNSITQCTYSGISAGWRWTSVSWELGAGYNLFNVEIAYNYFDHFMTDMSDGGAIYTLGGNVNLDYTAPLNELHDNYVVCDANTGNGKGRYMPLYHDGASSNWHSYNNVVVTAIPGNSGLGSFYVQIDLGGEGLNTQQAHNILCENNYFVNCDWQLVPTVKINGSNITAKSEQDYMERIVFWSHLRPECNTRQQNNHLVKDMNAARSIAECRAIMDNAGSSLGRD